MDENRISEIAAEDEYVDITADSSSKANTGINGGAYSAEPQPAKKKSPVQIPVIISAVIVLVAVLAYFAFSAFLLREPEGLTWSIDNDGTTYYYEFKNDGTVKMYIGTAEIEAGFEKNKGEDGNTITVVNNSANSGLALGNFYIGVPLTYNISGSRILKNQTMECSFDTVGYSFTLDQDSKKDVDLEVPDDFEADENIVGTWYFREDYKVVINENGTMSYENVQAKTVINGVYTVTDSTINFTYIINENTVVPFEYTVDGDVLNLMGFNFVKEGSDSTADQEAILPQQ